MGSRGQSASKGRRRAEARAARARAINEPEQKPQETREEKLAREKAFRESHVNFMGEWVEKPQTLSGWVEMGKVHELFSNKVEREYSGEVYEHEVTKSAEEIKEILKGINDLDVDVSRMKSPDKMVEKILEATRDHNLEKAKKDREWAVNLVGGTVNDVRGRNRPAMDGKDLKELLGINIKLYRDKAAAKAWHREWTKVLHPDNNPGNPKAETAMRRITDYYKMMIGR